MSRYHSICAWCGFEDTNDQDTPEDCGHPFFAIVDHIEPGHDDDEEECYLDCEYEGVHPQCSVHYEAHLEEELKRQNEE